MLPLVFHADRWASSRARSAGRVVEGETVSLRRRDGGRQNGMAIAEFVALAAERSAGRAKTL